MPEKLNLGCGFRKKPGYINIDIAKECEPDVVADLEKPWPLSDNSVDEIAAAHILEHLGAEPKVFLQFMREMYRVCVDGARILIEVPHHNHWTFHADPTHVRKILPETLRLFDQQQNREAIARGDADSPLGIYNQVDFVIESADPIYDQPWADRIQNGLILQHDLQFSSRYYNNCISQWRIVLRVRKPQ